MATQVTLNSGAVSSAGTLKLQTNGTTDAIHIDTSQNVGIGTSSPLAARKLTVQGRVAVSNASGSNDSQLAFYADGTTNGIYSTYNSTGSYLPMTFYTSDVERMRIDSGGNLLVGKTAANTTDLGVTIYKNGTASGRIEIVNGTAGGVAMQAFYYSSGVAIGSISGSNTATSYNTSSDYRLKNTIAPMTGALVKVAALKPVTYKWNADGSDGEGFIAHELAEVCPHAVTGEKDAVDADGNPVYQGIDTSFLVATLTAAIQEQQAIIQQLQADVAALKNK